MFDRFGREITCLRISVTNRCNFRCTYCMPEEGVPLRTHSEILSYEDIARVVRAGAALGIRKVRLTGGEPLVRRDLPTLVSYIAATEGIEHIGMTTNGSLLPRFAGELRRAGLSSVNISVDSLDPARFKEITRRGRLEDVLAGVDAAIEAGLSPIKINTVVSEGTTEAEVAALRAFTRERDLTLQLIAHYRLDVEKHNAYRFDRPPDCGACNRLRLTADGVLKPCLHSNAEVPVDPDDRARSLREAVRLIRDRLIDKGDVLTISRLAGIMAAKRTPELIPLCHSLGLDHAEVECELDAGGVAITATVRCTGRTGVEMEALTAVSVAALTVYDMCKAVDDRMRIGGIRLREKHKESAGEVG